LATSTANWFMQCRLARPLSPLRNLKKFIQVIFRNPIILTEVKKVIEALSQNRPVLAPSLLRVKQNSGKLSVPMQPHVARYVQFKHLVGVPTASNASGVPVAQLRMIDSMIENLIKGQSEAMKSQDLQKSITKGIYVDTWA